MISTSVASCTVPSNAVKVVIITRPQPIQPVKITNQFILHWNHQYQYPSEYQSIMESVPRLQQNPATSIILSYINFDYTIYLLCAVNNNICPADMPDFDHVYDISLHRS